MSLRAEYTHAAVFNPEARQWEVTVFYHEGGKAKVVGQESVAFEWQIVPTAETLISAHMEKVTRMLDTPVEPSEEADELAQRGDRLQQIEQDES